MNTRLICLLCTVMLAASYAQAGPEIIVRPNDKDRVVLEGKWKVGAVLAERQDAAPKAITFKPAIPQAGRYVLWLHTQRAPHVWQTKTPITVEHAEGVFRGTVNVAMGVEGWKPVGEFAFAPNKPATVRLEDVGGSKRIGFGAIRLTPAQDAGFPAPTSPDPAKARNPFEKQIFHHLRTLAGMNLANADDPAMRNALAQEAAEAAMAYHSLNRDEAREHLWYDTRFGDESLQAANNATRIARILAAYYSPHTPASLGVRGNPQVIPDMKAALTYVTDKLYNDKLNWNGAFWFQQEIGAPRAINDCLILLYPHIDRPYIDSQLRGSLKFMRNPRRFYNHASVSTGANRIFLCHVAVLRGLLTQNEEEIKTGRDAAREIFAYGSRSGAKSQRDGFFPDGSFIQHGTILYNWGYGNGLYNSFVVLYEALAGSPWAYQPEDMRLLGDFYLRGMATMVNFANLFPGAVGRAFGREKNPPPHVGSLPGVAANMLYMAPPDLKPAILQTFHQNMREVEALGLMDQFRRGNVAEMDRLVSAMRQTPPTLAKPQFSRVFYYGDALIHRRPDFVFGVVMSSRRIADHECIWGNNQNGWYQGHGMNWILDAGDPLKYAREYRPTVDPYRLPGVTLDKRERPPGSQAGGNSGKTNTRDWVGGVALDNLASAVGMEIEIVQADGKTVPLSGRKSWFAFDREILALGSGITCTSEYPVETIIENARVDNPATRLLINGQTPTLTDGTDTALPSVQWAHVAGNGSSPGLGVVFPQATTLTVFRGPRQGAWAQVQSKADATIHTRHFVTLLLNHGVGPTKAQYAYVLLPASDAERTAQIARANPVRILAQTADIHAAEHTELGLLAANFFAAGNAGKITADQPCSVLAQVRNDKIELALSDPTQQRDGPITVIFPGLQGKGLARADEGVTWVNGNPLTIRFNPKLAEGRGFTATINR